MSYDSGEFTWECTTCKDKGVTCQVKMKMPSGCVQSPNCPFGENNANFQRVGFRCIDDSQQGLSEKSEVASDELIKELEKLQNPQTKGKNKDHAERYVPRMCRCHSQKWK